MLNLVRGAARTRLSARVPLDVEALARLERTGTLIVDARRRRPLYFDGRFLAARDLTRDQEYALMRQADLGRATGGGVVHGLDVSRGPGGSELTIQPGHGITPQGESVIVGAPLTVRLWDIPEIRRLDAAFGIAQRPNDPPRNRTGLYVLALRPVEFTANPIASYPTEVTGQRSVHDGDVIEATAVSLIPWRDDGAATDLDRRRSAAARAIFVDAATGGLPVDALPLAMLAANRDEIPWVDPWLVRRDLGTSHMDILGLGFAPRATREAYVRQYDAQLAHVLAVRGAAGGRFAAADYFDALPPAGQLPAAAVDPQAFTQVFFPPQVRVDVSFVPQEELPALVEESLRLPPIDLRADGDALESTAVLVVVPVPLARLRALVAQLAPLVRALPSAAPGLIAQRRPIELLRTLALTRLPQLAVRPPATDPWIPAMRDALAASDGVLWYVRRRNVSYRADLTGLAVRLVGDDAAAERALDQALAEAGLEARVDALTDRASTLARAELVGLLASPKLVRVPALLRAAVVELEAARTMADDGTPRALDRAAVLRVAERFSAPTLGDGLARLQQREPRLRDDAAVVDGLARTKLVPEVDRAAPVVADAALGDFARKLADAAAAGDAKAVADLLAAVTLEQVP